MFSVLKRIIRRYLRRSPKSQNHEAEVLESLLSWACIPQTFVEFGFHAQEFNCARLIERFNGLLIDGDRRSVDTARSRFPRNIQIECQFIDLQNLEVIEGFCRGKELGILSIDVDGNDFWFLKALLHLRPVIIIVEYNASLALRSLSVPYDKNFVRHAKHASGWYHGASLPALDRLCIDAGYGLVSVAPGGCNAFFMRRELCGDRIRKPEQVYMENQLRNQWSKTTAAEQWEVIKHLPFITI